MKIGKLRHRIEIQGKHVSRSSFGEEVIEWVTFITTWASVEPLIGKEYFATKQTQASTSHKITMRYQMGIKPYNRVKYGDRIFDINAILNVEEKDRELVIYATESI